MQVVKAYLFKALRRHLGDETKLLKKHRHLLPTYTDSFEVTYSHEEFLIAQQGDAEQSARLLAALNQLSKRQREALYLKFYINDALVKTWTDVSGAIKAVPQPVPLCIGQLLANSIYNSPFWWLGHRRHQPPMLTSPMLITSNSMASPTSRARWMMSASTATP